MPGSSDNHQVRWVQFYHWIYATMHASEDSTLFKALSPYRPDYTLGSVISVQERDKVSVAKH